jgi:nucleotide-binding universal stress UspA family protein
VAFQRILIATDFSEHSDAAARRGLEVAAAFGSEVLFLHVFDVSQLPIISAYPYYYGHINQQMVDDLRKRAEDLLEAFASKHDPSGNGKRRMVAGAPGTLIVEEAVAMGADLIVMGASGIGRVHELLGSVVHQVVRESKIPVLTVR